MIGWLPLRQAEVELSTPAPVYEPADFTVAQLPARIPSPHKLRAMNAAVRARKAYPGYIGEILADALTSYAELGYLARADHPLHQLIAQLMDGPLPDNVA